MGIHSQFLVHWTGKDLTSGDSSQFVNRLKNCCEFGLYMKSGNELIYGSTDTTVTANVSRVCFTEIRLSQALSHSHSYGGLGIGFNRCFVLERMGGPVFYVQNGINSVTIDHFAHVHKYFRNISNQVMIDRMNTIMGFLKNLSDVGDNNLSYYEEMEWRIIQVDCLMDRYIVPVNSSTGIYRVKFNPEDVELIVFPDKETKKLALKDDYVLDFFKDYQPMITTVDDCAHF